MKFLILLLTLAFCLADPTLRNLKSIDIKTVLSTAATQMVQASVAAGEIPEDIYMVFNISNTTQEETDNAILYYGTLTVVNGNGLYIDANISASVDDVDHQIVVNMFDYTILHNYTAPNNTAPATNTSTVPAGPNYTVPNGYTALTLAQVNSNNATLDILDFGLNAVIDISIQQNKCPDLAYNLKTLPLAAIKPIGRGSFYIFYANLFSPNYVHIDVNFTAYYNGSANGFILGTWAYYCSNYTKSMLSNNTKPVNNGTTGSNPPATNTTGGTSGGNTATPPISGANNTNSGAGNGTIDTPPVNNTKPPVTTAPVNTTTPPVTTPPVVNTTTPDGFTIIPADKVAANVPAQNALTYGINALLNILYSQNKVPYVTYNLQSVGAASYKSQNNGVNYKFTVGLINAKNAHIDANLTVFDYKTNQNSTLLGYSWRYYTSTAGGTTPIGGNVSTGNNTSGSNPATNTTKPTNTTSPGGSTGGNGTTSPGGSTGSNGTVVTPPVTNNTSGDGYTYLNLAQVSQNATLQGYINSGTAYVIQLGINQTKIPNTPFTLVNITSFGTKAVTVPVKGTNYNVVANMKNANGVTVSMTFTQFQQANSQRVQVSAYSYNVKYPSGHTSNAPKAVNTPSNTIVPPVSLTADNTLEALGVTAPEVVN